MKRNSVIDIFLARQYSQGERDSEGVFTLSAERALSKISENALPFESAWVLKVIQAAVAADFEEIQIRLLRGCIEIELEGSCPWHPEELTYLLQVVEAGSTLGLKHLISALRDRLAEDAPLLFLLKGHASSLYWNGDELRQQPTEQESTRTILCVRTGDSSLGTDFASLSILGAQSALIGQTISDNAFLCPIPLTVDARRVDMLIHVTQEENRFGVPVALGWATSPTYRLHLSPQESNTRALDSLPESLQTYREHLTQSAEHTEGVPWVVRVHFQSREVEQEGRTVKIWDVAKGPSTVNFVKDGILVDQHPLWDAPEHVSLHIFVNARGMKTDISGFALVETPERETASQFARESARDILQQLVELDLPPDDAFPTTSWGNWLIRLLVQPVEDEKVDSPATLREQIEKSYASLRAQAELQS